MTTSGWFAVRSTRHVPLASPTRVKLHDRELVLFRAGNGRLSVLDGFCPHRRAPLHLGRVVEGELECPYHGWRFDHRGQCTTIPGLAKSAGCKAIPQRSAETYRVVESQGLVWVSLDQADPGSAPPTIDFPDPEAWRISRLTYEFAADLGWVLENMSDFSHVPFAHARSVGAGRVPLLPAMRLVETGTERCPAASVSYRLQNQALGFARLLAWMSGTFRSLARDFEIEVRTQYIWPGHIATRLCLEAGPEYRLYFFVSPEGRDRTHLEYVSARNFLRAPAFDKLEQALLRKLFAEDARLASASDFRQIVTTQSSSADTLGIYIRRQLHKKNELPLSVSSPPTLVQ